MSEASQDLYNRKNYPRMILGDGWFRSLIINSRIGQVENVIKPKKGDKILDIGCDEGVAIRMLEGKYNIEGYGIDVSADAVKKASHPRLKYGSAEKLPFADETFDGVFSLHTIEHVENLPNFFSEAERVLKSGSYLVVVYPWEIFRGMTVIPDILFRGKLPTFSMIRRIHRHNIKPWKVRELTRETNLTHIRSNLFWGFPYLVPQYVSVFKKI